ncbi:hypothetical protein Bhyg_15962, partial [Pseudolycoriella hygida]
MRINLAFLILLLLKRGLSQVVSNTEDNVKEILDFLREGDGMIKSTEQRDIIYLLGPTGTGKTTLAHLLTGNPNSLRSVETDEDSDDFVIEQLSDDKIGSVTFQSKTIYPDLLVDENNVPFYDCPGFSDTRNMSIEIATTYFTKKAINFADRVKIVFVVNYNSMLKGFSSRRDFADFVKQATEFLKNVKAYRDGIILVASKVPVYAGQINNDTKMLNKVKNFLTEYRKFLIEDDRGTNASLSKSDQKVLNNKLDLLDIFLLDERIVLFKRPIKSGVVSDIPGMMRNRDEMLDSINRKINFVEMSDDDFGYTLSDRSKLQITAVTEEINQMITTLFESISEKVIDYYSQKMLPFNNIDNLKIECENVLQTLSKISDGMARVPSTPTYLLAVKQLNIPNIQQDVDDIMNHIDYIQFFEIVHDEPISMRTADWAGALNKCLQFLENEKNWHLFVEKLLDYLSGYDVQKNTSNYDVTNIERWGLGDNLDENLDNSYTRSGIFITEENFEDFLKKFMAFELVKDTEATKGKIDSLNDILNGTIKTKPTCNCDRNKLTIKGNFMKISDLERYEKICEEKVDLIEVFGMSTIFFDTDIRKHVDLVVIAPKWHVVKSPVQIILDGDDGKDEDNIVTSHNLLNGKPGRPGQNANNFFGFGKEFVNIDELHITAVGGNGGRGQDGSNGTDGLEIQTPPDGSDGKLLGRHAKSVHLVEDSHIGFLFFNRKHWEYETYESSVHCPSINGIGGSGGLSGSGGTIELNGMPGIKILVKDGELGSPGKHGKCGKSFNKVELFKTKTKECIFWFFCGKKITWTSRRLSDATCLQKCQNSTLVNVNGLLKPAPVKRLNSALSIDQYKVFVRENVHTLPINPKLAFNFLRSMEENLKIRQAYDTAAFIDDFYQIEKQFHAFKNENNFVFFYQSLLDRILEYVANPSNEFHANERTILANLYTAGLSKICQIQSGTEQSLIVDMNSYLDVAIGNIQQLEKIGKQNALNQFKNEYRKHMETRINDNQNIISLDIMPEIEKLNVQIESMFEKSLDKVVKEKYSVADNAVHYSKMKSRFEESINLRGVFKVLKVVARVASFFTGFGSVAGRTIDTMSQIANVFSDNRKHQNPSDKISFTVSDEFQDNFSQLERNEQNFKHQKTTSILGVIEDILQATAGLSFDNFLIPLMSIKRKLTDSKRVDLSSEEIDILETEVQNMVRNKTAELRNNSRKEPKLLRTLENVGKKLAILQIDVDLFKKIAANDRKLQEIESITRQSQTKLFELNNFERSLLRSIDPMLKQIQLLLNDIPGNLNDYKTHEKLPLAAIKWRVQNMLKDLRYHMQQFRGDSFYYKRELLHLFDKLDTTISTLSSIYHQMEIYEDQVKLSSYIANIESADYTFEDNASTEDLENVNRLNFIIKSNVLLTIFDHALNGFKQTIFPFADFYLRSVNLPQQFNGETDLQGLVKQSSEELVSLK